MHIVPALLELCTEHGEEKVSVPSSVSVPVYIAIPPNIYIYIYIYQINIKQFTGNTQSNYVL